MSGIFSSELLFRGGIAVMLLTAAAGVLAVVVFTVSGRHLKKKLEGEFGKKRH